MITILEKFCTGLERGWGGEGKSDYKDCFRSQKPLVLFQIQLNSLRFLFFFDWWMFLWRSVEFFKVSPKQIHGNMICFNLGDEILSLNKSN